MTFTEDRWRFEAYGWHVQKVKDGNDLEQSAAVAAAQAETERPSIIVIRTLIGYGSPHKQGTPALMASRWARTKSG